PGWAQERIPRTEPDGQRTTGHEHRSRIIESLRRDGTSQGGSFDGGRNWQGDAVMPNTFGSFVVHQDAIGFHILHNLPKRLEEIVAERMQYAGPRVIMPETVPDLDKWLVARKRQGFTF